MALVATGLHVAAAAACATTGIAPLCAAAPVTALTTLALTLALSLPLATPAATPLALPLPLSLALPLPLATAAGTWAALRLLALAALPLPGLRDILATLLQLRQCLSGRCLIAQLLIAVGGLLAHLL